MTSAPSHHLIPAVGGWAYWRRAWLRTPGFSVDRLDALALPDTVAHLERAEQAERARARAREDALTELQALTESIRGEEGRLIGKAMRALRKDRIPEQTLSFDAAAAAALASYAAAHRAWESATTAAVTRFEQESKSVGDALRETVRDPLFREAVLWQNRRALHGSMEALLRKPTGAVDSKTREHERLVASYVQRYVAKNETIGFFGPVAWAELGAGEGASARHGRALLLRRRVYFERWAVESLADAIAERFMPYAPVRANPGRMHGKDALGSEVATLLDACDGRPAVEIARGLLASNAVDAEDEEDVYELFAQLAESQLVRWTFEIPVWHLAPEEWLRERLASIEAPSPRAEAMALLDRIVERRDAVAAAAGDVAALDQALADLEAEFAELTGQRGQRREGQAYAGRTLVYEDCVRDLDCRLGADLLERLARPLSLVLDSARWFTHEIGRCYQQIWLGLFDELAAQRSDAVVPFFLFFQRLAERLGDWRSLPPEISAVRQDLQDRWTRILGFTEEERRIHRTSKDLAPALLEAFAAPGPGWPLARYHSPDVLVAAKDVSALDRGEVTFVLGELHVCVNSHLCQVSVGQHPDPDAIFAACAEDLDGPIVTPVESRRFSTRADYMPARRKDPHLETSDTISPNPRDRVFGTAELFVQRRGDRLFIFDAPRRLDVDAVRVLGQYLSFAAISSFDPLPFARHTPRVQVDDLVIARERWRFAPSDFRFYEEKTPYERFVAARRFAQAGGIPRRVFAKVPNELKPFLVDFDSSVLVEILCRRLKKAESLQLTEMLPDREDCWVEDAEGRRFTSELRIVAVDDHPTE